MKRILFTLVALVMVLGMTLPVQASDDQHLYRIYDVSITGDQSAPAPPPECSYYTNPVCVSGNASVTNFQGNIWQYHVRLEWVQNDGSYRSTILADTDFDPLPGDDRSFSGNWSIPCQEYPPGNYIISIQLYHSQPQGHEELLYTYPAPICIVIVPVDVPPSVTTRNATDIVIDSAILNGNLTSLGSASSVAVDFQWATDQYYTEHGNTYSNPTAFSDMFYPAIFSYYLTGLTQGTTYHFRAKAVGNGEAHGADMTFTTSAAPPAPVVLTLPASDIGTSTATLNGNLTSLGTASNVEVSFQWASESYYTTHGNTYENSLADGTKSSIGTFVANLTGLTQGTTYHFRAKAVSNGEAHGADMTFTTKRTTPPGPPPYVVVSLISIKVTPDNATVIVGGTQQFTAIAYYSDGTSSNITSSATWSSDDTFVATVNDTVNPKGLAIGVGIGSTRITASYSGKSGSATLNVMAPHTLLALWVTPESASIHLGQTQQFEAWAAWADTGFVNVTGTASWASGNITVAPISTGLATGVGVGTTGITARYEGATSNTATLTVVLPVITSIAINTGDGTVAVCEKKQLTATATYSDDSTRDVTNEVVWSSSDTGKATIGETGLATGINVGEVAIIATLSEVSGSATLTVMPSNIVSIEVTPSSASILVNGKQQFRAMAIYSDGSSSNVTSKASWRSSKENLATVEAGGLAAGKAAGSTNITASFCNVTSNPADLSVTVGVPWSMIGWIIAAAIAAGLFLFFLLRRRKKDGEEIEAA